MGSPIRWKTAILPLAAMLALAACDGSGSSHSEPPQTKADTVQQALEINEAQGLTPALDRSDSIAGPDANEDGVRDDVEAYIAGLEDSDEQKSALRQMSRALQAAMTADPADDASLREATRKMNDAVACIWDRYSAEYANHAVSEVQKVMVNTRERFDAYGNYNSAVSGTVVSLPKEVRCES